MPDDVVEVSGLSRRFGTSLALDNVSLRMQAGYVYGLVGANGQGKTTLIKHLLGLLKAKSGSVRIFGLDPIKNRVAVLKRIGYLSEERELPEWMTVQELLDFTSAFHPTWDRGYADHLIATFRLDPRKKIAALSKGMRAQAGLIAAVAHRPELLLLDEPSTGLDAIVRKDILNEIIRTVADDRRTVLFSSHLLDEVEQMSDRVLMMQAGQLILHGELDGIKESYTRWIVRFDKLRTSFPAIRQTITVDALGDSWRVITEGDADHFIALVSAAGGSIQESRSATLQEIFLAKASRSKEVLEV